MSHLDSADMRRLSPQPEPHELVLWCLQFVEGGPQQIEHLTLERLVGVEFVYEEEETVVPAGWPAHERSGAVRHRSPSWPRR